MKDNIIKYSPIVLVVITMIFQWHLFVSPELLEKKHRDILADVAKNYVTKDLYNAQYQDIKHQMNDMQNKLDKIYEILSKN